MKYALDLPTQSDGEYTLISSPRAKYLRIKISPLGEIKVVVPKGMNMRHAHDFVEQKKDWIAKALQKVDAVPKPEIAIPEQLDLKLIKECWQVAYRATDYNGVILARQSSDQSTTMRQLVLEGMVDNQELVFNVLEQCLKRRAKAVFPEKLDELSEQFSLPYQRLTIRGQKTRWGSCSSKQNINLNYKLLFFPESVVRYVFIHELCHTREMNHSKRFWGLVAECDPDYALHRKVLKNASEFVPAGF